MGESARLVNTIKTTSIIVVVVLVLHPREIMAQAAHISNSKTGAASYAGGRGTPLLWSSRLLTPIATTHSDIKIRKKSPEIFTHNASPSNPAIMKANELIVLKGSCQLPGAILSQYIPMSATPYLVKKSSIASLLLYGW